MESKVAMLGTFELSASMVFISEVKYQHVIEYSLLLDFQNA